MAASSPTDEVPVERRDLLALFVVSVLGGILLAVAVVGPQLTPQFFSAIFVGACLLAFFLFIPIMGIRLFIHDWTDD